VISNASGIWKNKNSNLLKIYKKMKNKKPMVFVAILGLLSLSMYVGIILRTGLS